MAKPDSTDKFLDDLLKGKTPEEVLGEGGVLKDLTRRLVERALEGEMTDHLGYETNAAEGKGTGNSRNGKTKKTVKTDSGEIEIQVPRDRTGEFDPQLVTESVLEDVKTWQSRPLDPVYPIAYLDAIHLKLRSSGHVQNQAVYLALGINLEGYEELLGLWVGQSEGSKFWLNVLTELKNRGLQDILIACVDGLKGFPDAIETIYPKTQTQLCIVHMVRNSLKYVSWKERKDVAGDLRSIYTASAAEAASQALDAFAEKWDDRFPSNSRSWRSRWENVIPFFSYPPEIRKMIYTTNAIRIDSGAAPSGDQEARGVPERGLRAEGDLPGPAAGIRAVGPADQRLGASPQPLLARF